MSNVGPSIFILNEDLLYLIFQQVTSGPSMTLRAQREELFSFALVSHQWSRAAQSLLFRHVFLQIRRSMLSFLQAVSRKTERGRTLATYVRTLTLKLSTKLEAQDPPPLPMIHTRHVPGILAHVPVLHELDLIMGEQRFTLQQLEQMARLQSIRVLTLSTGHPIELMFQHDKTRDLFKNIRSLSLPKAWYSDTFPNTEPNKTENNTRPNPPPFSLVSLEMGAVNAWAGYYTAPDLAWLLTNSMDTLQYLTIHNASKAPAQFIQPFSTHLKFLTLRSVFWNEELVNVLRSEHLSKRLQELRLLDNITIEYAFPGAHGFPSSLKHLTLAFPLVNSAAADPTQPSPYELTMHIPTHLQTLTTTKVYWSIPTSRILNWANNYLQACRSLGVEVTEIEPETTYRGNPPSEHYFRQHVLPAHPELNIGPPSPKLRPPAFPRVETIYEPTESQLDLTDFRTVFNNREGNIVDREDLETPKSDWKPVVLVKPKAKRWFPLSSLFSKNAREKNFG